MVFSLTHSGAVTFMQQNTQEWVSTTIRCGDLFASKTFRHGSPPPFIINFKHGDIQEWVPITTNNQHSGVVTFLHLHRGALTTL